MRWLWLHDHIKWAKFVNSIEYEEWMCHIIFNIVMNLNLALKSLNGLLIDPHSFRNYCLYFMNIVIDYWMMIQTCHIILVYLLVLFVGVWTSKNDYLLNQMGEAMIGLLITIVGYVDILDWIVLLVMKTLIVFSWNYVERTS